MPQPWELQHKSAEVALAHFKLSDQEVGVVWVWFNLSDCEMDNTSSDDNNNSLEVTKY